MPKIAISYRRADTQDITGRIFDRLASHYGRESIFRDIDNIRPGVDFREEIARAWRHADLLLVIMGPKWIGRAGWRTRIKNASDPVRIEVETALDQHIPIIPVLVGGTKMLDPSRLPASIQRFAYRHAVTVDGGVDFEMHVGRLRHEIDRVLAGGIMAPEASAMQSPASDKPASVLPVRDLPQRGKGGDGGDKAESAFAIAARETTVERPRPNRRALLIGGARIVGCAALGLAVTISSRKTEKTSFPIATTDSGAQQPTARKTGKTFRLALIGPISPTQEMLSAFREGLHQRDYIEGKNLSIDVSWPRVPTRRTQASSLRSCEATPTLLSRGQRRLLSPPNARLRQFQSCSWGYRIRSTRDL